MSAPKGRIITRHVPKGTEEDYAGARYDVVGSLPAILAKRQLNRGIESLAVSRDERFLFFALQSPLANPDTAAFRHLAQCAAVPDRTHLDADRR